MKPKSIHKAHPWHGIGIGPKAPEVITTFIEIVPTDTVKYEIDKETGYLKIDRPQRYSNIVPALYGFIPQTYCDTLVANFAQEKSGKKIEKGDGDPLDICVLTEQAIPHGDILCQAIPIGGLRLLDKGEADDKIIAVLKDDAIYGRWRDISDVPAEVIARLRHYFLTYKNIPGETATICEIDEVYNRQTAYEVIGLSQRDYQNTFGK
jgi:inorganic pyrophosphatase